MVRAVLHLTPSCSERLLSNVLDAHVVRNYVDHVKSQLLALLGVGRVECVDAALLAGFGGRGLDLDQGGVEFLGNALGGDAVANVVT